MDTELKQTLINLAEKYETSDFLQKDPSQFMHCYSSAEEQEVVAFISANLAFGRRDQILKHIELILDEMEYDWCRPSQWIRSGKYKDFFTLGEKSFYRMYTHNDMLLFFDTLKIMLEKEGTLGEFIHKRWIEKTEGGKNPVYLHQVISEIFPAECQLIPHTKETSAKKLNMLLRWMVRDNSPVDLGIWTWYKKSDLLMPLDTHVMQESVNFGLLEKTESGKIPSANLKSCVKLTEIMKEVFGDDPLRGDFALFGLGVDKTVRE